MAEIRSIDGKKLPRELADYILKNEKDIKSAVLSVFTHSEPDEVTHHFVNISTGELAYAILTMLVCFIQELASHGED